LYSAKVCHYMWYTITEIPFWITVKSDDINFTTKNPTLVEQELLSLPEHLSSPRFLKGFLLLDL
jgi:hypothetical protein